jgi:general secretion pathway protein N
VKRGALIAAGAAAFLVCLVAMLPAAQLARRLPPAVALSGVGGTVWSGEARLVAVHGRPLGALDWSCSPWRIFVLQWSCAVTLKPPGGEVSGELSGNFRELRAAQGLRGRVPIRVFEGIATPRGWTGDLEVQDGEISLAGNRPASARGTMFLRQLRPPGASAQNLGDFELVVGEGKVGGEALQGRLRDLGGPLHVRGAVELKTDGQYLLTGDAAPGPGAGPSIFDALGFLGAPDAQGRRPFTIEGSL